MRGLVMSERPTEALQRRIDGDGQGLMFKDGQPVPMRPVPISELREAADTIAALTAEVRRLRVHAIITTEWIEAVGIDTASLHAQLRAAFPSPPADQPATSLSTEEGLIRSLTEVRNLLTHQPAPATKPLSSAEEVRHALGIPESPACPYCKGTGRAPSEWRRLHKDAVSGEGGG